MERKEKVRGGGGQTHSRDSHAKLEREAGSTNSVFPLRMFKSDCSAFGQRDGHDAALFITRYLAVKMPHMSVFSKFNGTALILFFEGINFNQPLLMMTRET